MGRASSSGVGSPRVRAPASVFFPSLASRLASRLVAAVASPRERPFRPLTLDRSSRAGPPLVLASLLPGRVETVPLDVLLTDDVRISVRVVARAAAAAAAAASRARFAVHLTGDVDLTFEQDLVSESDSDSDSPPRETRAFDASEEDVDMRHSEDEDAPPSDSGDESDSWGSGDDLEDLAAAVAADAADAATADDTTKRANGDDDASIAARRAAASRGAAGGGWTTPVPGADDAQLRRWEGSGDWAYHVQTSGARQHRRSSRRPDFSWTGTLRPREVSPRRAVPSLGWLSPLPDYARTGWPDEEFGSELQRKLEVKTEAQMAKMRAASSLGRAVMDAVAAAIAPGVTTDELDRVCHAMTLCNGAYPSPRRYMGFPKSICTSVNEVVCHGIPDARPLEDGDIVNLDVTVCLNGYHGDLNETYLVGTGAGHPERTEASKKLMAAALECLELAIARCRPGTRFRDLGEVIQTRAHADGFGVVKDFCGHGIGELFHCAPNVPHYARNKAAGTMRPGMTFTIEPMVNEGTHKTKTWPDGWTAVTADGGRSAQYEHTLAITETGVEVLTARTPNSKPLW